MAEKFTLEVSHIEFICKFDVINHSIAGIALGSLLIVVSMLQPCALFLDVALYHIDSEVVSIKSA